MDDCNWAASDAINIFLGKHVVSPGWARPGRRGWPVRRRRDYARLPAGWPHGQRIPYPRHGPRRRKILEITCWVRAQAVGWELQGAKPTSSATSSPSDDGPGMGSEHAVLGGPTVSVTGGLIAACAKRQYPQSGRKEHPRPTPGSWWRLDRRKRPSARPGERTSKRCQTAVMIQCRALSGARLQGLQHRLRRAACRGRLSPSASPRTRGAARASSPLWP